MNEGSIMTRAEQKENRKQEILSVGLDLFIRKGYTDTKISDIAETAVMSVGLLFHYFESKENLYEELIRNAISGPKFVMTFDQSDPLYFFETVVHNIFGAITSEPFIAKMLVLINQAQCNEATPQSVKQLITGIDNVTASISIIEEGQKNGTIRQGNAHALSVAYWSAIQGIAETLAIHPDTPCPDSSWIVDIIRRREP